MATDSDFLDSLSIRLVDDRMDLDAFKCKQEIDWFLKHCAVTHHQKRITSVVCWMDGNTIAGYLTTSMTTVELAVPDQRKELDLDGVAFTNGGKYNKFFPALLIGMLGVSEQYLKKGLGERMVRFAIGQAHELSRNTGCRFVTVDADPTPAALGLYRKLTFRNVAQKNSERATLWMYYDLGQRPIT